jgi:hypothetical protein
MAVTSSRRDVLHFSYGTAGALGVSALASAGALGITPVQKSGLSAVGGLAVMLGVIAPRVTGTVV